MNAQLLAVLQKLEAADLAILESALVPAVFAEIQQLSAKSAIASEIEAVVFPAVQPAVQSAFAGLLAKIPVAPAQA
jgi:hypothetical protein